MNEVWKEIGSTQTKIFYISSHGQLKHKTVHGEQLIKPTKNRNHYVANVWLSSIGNKKRNISIHLEVAKAFIPNPEGLKYIIHLDGDTSNNHYKNLKWATLKDLKRYKKSLGGN